MLKAAPFNQFGGPEVLEIADLPDPHPGPGQVRIAVRAAGVNPSDWKKRKGLMDGGLPQTMGHEAAGVVDELGGGVADVAVGDRVFGFSAAGSSPRTRGAAALIRTAAQVRKGFQASATARSSGSETGPGRP
jgi:NADPH:quinone reductase-like Zn-dependent oxidoreductase